ncbi:hypothetical protein FACS1894172_13870 [Spirochaetia bacterium]|nr:hypothetical protein FACS1894164_08850 [Spirochaetia bacterium]GHU34089.1 hypothetical protein FACS1894172_13870 [Spirochaetia bacterium]
MKVKKYLLDSFLEEELSIRDRVCRAIHLLLYSQDADQYKKIKEAEQILQSEFFAEPPEFEDAVMEYIRDDAADGYENTDNSGVSFGSWIVTGFVILISLSTVFLNMDFENVAATYGSSFLLPVGITIGAILTGYGALFIGSHLKELSEHFGLH